MMSAFKILDILTADYLSILGDNLVGIYLHGSLAFGCFTWSKSDIDFIVVVEHPLTLCEKTALIKTLLDLDSKAPPKGFEMSVVLSSVCKPFVYPTPYELHFSNGHKQAFIADLAGHAANLHGLDPDLAAHFTVIKAVGKTLCGAAIDEVFGEVSKRDYLDSIYKDIEGAKGDILRDPVYMILNLCRVLGCLRGCRVMSKKDGGGWGIANIPKHSDIIKAALSDYLGGEKMNVAEGDLLSFADYMLSEISACVSKQNIV